MAVDPENPGTVVDDQLATLGTGAGASEAALLAADESTVPAQPPTFGTGAGASEIPDQTAKGTGVRGGGLRGDSSSNPAEKRAMSPIGVKREEEEFFSPHSYGYPHLPPPSMPQASVAANDGVYGPTSWRAPRGTDANLQNFMLGMQSQMHQFMQMQSQQFMQNQEMLNQQTKLQTQLIEVGVKQSDKSPTASAPPDESRVSQQKDENYDSGKAMVFPKCPDLRGDDASRAVAAGKEWLDRWSSIVEARSSSSFSTEYVAFVREAAKEQFAVYRSLTDAEKLDFRCADVEMPTQFVKIDRRVRGGTDDAVPNGMFRYFFITEDYLGTWNRYETVELLFFVMKAMSKWSISDTARTALLDSVEKPRPPSRPSQTEVCLREWADNLARLTQFKVAPPEVSRIRLQLPATCKYLDKEMELANDRCDMYRKLGVANADLSVVVQYIHFFASLSARMRVTQDNVIDNQLQSEVEVCSDWQSGRCARGEKCLYKHVSEQRFEMTKAKACHAKEKEQPWRSRQDQPKPSASLFVRCQAISGTDYAGVKAKLATLFGKQGTVMIPMLDEQMRGHCHVQMASVQAAEQALQRLNGTQFNEQGMLVKFDKYNGQPHKGKAQQATHSTGAGVDLLGLDSASD